ncbi:FecR domain-containing protein [Porticoccaceae bacterium]|nr:FecR domain-containing protein [Porticoccaceae bacterium]
MSNHNDTQPNSGAVLEFPDHKSIHTQASEWLAKLDAEQPSQRDLARFKQWVNADPAHRIAFEELVDFWDEMNILTQAVLPRELMHPDQPTAKKDEPTAISASGRRFFPNTRATFAASFVAIAGLVLAFMLQLGSATVYSTGIGEQRIIQLADNSTVQLNTNSRLEVDYSSSLRRLNLTQGEAHFDVAHNPSRPFEVYAGSRLVRAIGTAFTVHVRKIDVEVIVTQGTVEIDRPPQPDLSTNITVADNSQQPGNPVAPASTVKASAGTMLTFDKDLLNDVQVMVASQLEQDLSWRHGMLIFKGEPLQSVVDEISRYTDLKIIIPERHAREMKVGGLFKVGDTESLFEALRDGFDIHVKEVSKDVVYLISNENG